MDVLPHFRYYGDPILLTHPAPVRAIGLDESIKPLRVLIADDSPLIRQYLRQLLGSSTFADIIAESTTAESTIEVVAEKHPDVVVLDIEMPGSGIRALRQIKVQSPDTVVVMLTNHAGPYYERVCLAAGADYFLDKSIEFDKVTTVLASLTAS